VISVSVELALHKWSAPKKNRDPNIPQIAVDIRGHSVDDLRLTPQAPSVNRCPVSKINPRLGWM